MVVSLLNLSPTCYTHFPGVNSVVDTGDNTSEKDTRIDTSISTIPLQSDTWLAKPYEDTLCTGEKRGILTSFFLLAPLPLNIDV